MLVDLELVPKTKRPAGQPCCAPVVYPEVERRQAERMAAIAKALGDPGCVPGALTEAEFRAALTAAGFEDIEIRHTHRVHPPAGSAIIRARKPAASACCSASDQEVCCEPAAKADCCGPADTRPARTCGCR